MRIAGAQIPVSRSVNDNCKEILTACEWAVENKVDYLFTPEASLSGYDTPSFTLNTCGETEQAMDKIVQYASAHSLGLMIGTLWLDEKEKLNGPFYGTKTNQIRFYNTKGEYIGSTKKTKLVSFDQDCEAQKDAPVIEITTQNEKLKVGTLICNDLVGNYYFGGPNLARQLKDVGVDIIVHTSNTQKDQGPYVKKVHDEFHDACTKLVTYATNIPIISVDNPWHIHGTESKEGTSFTSGIYLPIQTLYQAPKTGTHYFYYDTSQTKYSYQEGNK